MSSDETRVSLRMPTALHEQLTVWAEMNGRTFSDEVRLRLSASFGPEPPGETDPKTREFLFSILHMAEELSGYYPPWYEDPFSFKAFLTGIYNFLVWRRRPPGDLNNPEPKPNPGSFAADESFHKKATVDSVGAMLASAAIAIANYDPKAGPR